MKPSSEQVRIVHAIGIDVGGTKVVGGTVTESGDVGPVVRRPTPRQGGVDLLECVVDVATEVLQAATDAGLEVVACGVGTAGVVVDDRIVSANALLPWYAGLPLADELRRALRVPVAVLNDVHASALAESAVGAARGYGSALVVAVGTGIGGGLVLDGEVVQGRQGIAGSIGHMPAPVTDGRLCACGAVGHLEAHAGGRSIEAIYNEGSTSSVDLPEIAVRASRGEQRAITTIATAGELLGRVLGGAANLVDPEVVVIAGGVAQIGDPYLDAVRTGMAREEMRPGSMPPLRPAALQGRSALVGGALSAFRRYGSSVGGS